MFLGSVESEHPSSIASWLVAVGVDDLTLVPPQLVVHIGGLMYYVQAYVEAYHRAPLYTADDMPKHPIVYRRPIPPPSSSSSSDGDTLMDTQDLIPMSSRVLREICRGRTADSLPPELQQFASMDVIEMQDPCMATPEFATLDPTPPNQPPHNAPQKQQAVSQNPPQKQQPVSQSSLDQHMRLEVPTGVTDRIVRHRAIAIPSTIKPVHKLTPLAPTIPRDPTPKTILPTVHHAANDVTGHPKGVSDSLHEGPRKIQPQRILLRGETSIPAANHHLPLLKSRSIPSVPEDISKSAALDAQFPEQIDSTFPLESKIHKKRMKPLDPKKIPQKAKGFPCGPLKGPFSSKYKWTRPLPNAIASTSETIKKGKETARPKRRSELPPAAGPAKRTTGKEKLSEKASITLNPEGFYEVQVQYDHIAELASACGFKNNDLEDILAMDNEQRRIQAKKDTDGPTITEEVPELDMTRFDPDPEDELTSDEDI